MTAERALASRTAQYVALYRALETAVSERAPLFSDPFAARFLGRSYQRAVTLSRLRPFRVVLEAYADYRAPGARTSAIARTRFIDDVVREDAGAGTKQLVILGAGYDCRAHRLEELRTCRVFEVDRAATQDEKRRHLGADSRGDVVYVPIDFGVDDLGASLDRAAFDRSLRTTFIWEGVTNYLDEASVGKVLRFVGTMPPGSRLVFTYVHRGVIDGSVDFPGGAKIRQNAGGSANPGHSGCAPKKRRRFCRASVWRWNETSAPMRIARNTPSQPAVTRFIASPWRVWISWGAKRRGRSIAHLGSCPISTTGSPKRSGVVI